MLYLEDYLESKLVKWIEVTRSSYFQQIYIFFLIKTISVSINNMLCDIISFFQRIIFFWNYCKRLVLTFKRSYVLCFLVIEHLPQELRDRFTEMRELDLQVQSKI